MSAYSSLLVSIYLQNTSGSTVYAGNSSNSLRIWGAQFELANVADQYLADYVNRFRYIRSLGTKGVASDYHYNLDPAPDYVLLGSLAQDRRRSNDALENISYWFDKNALQGLGTNRYHSSIFVGAASTDRLFIGGAERNNDGYSSVLFSYTTSLTIPAGSVYPTGWGQRGLSLSPDASHALITTVGNGGEANFYTLNTSSGTYNLTTSITNTSLVQRDGTAVGDQFGFSTVINSNYFLIHSYQEKPTTSIVATNSILPNFNGGKVWVFNTTSQTLKSEIYHPWIGNPSSIAVRNTYFGATYSEGLALNSSQAIIASQNYQINGQVFVYDLNTSLAILTSSSVRKVFEPNPASYYPAAQTNMNLDSPVLYFGSQGLCYYNSSLYIAAYSYPYRNTSQGNQVVVQGAVFKYDVSNSSTSTLVSTIYNPEQTWHTVDGKFGSSIDAYSSLLIIGAPEVQYHDTATGTRVSQGRVYVLWETSTALKTTLYNPNITPQYSSSFLVDNFGSAVATDGNYIAVGAPQENRDTSGTAADGVVYVFNSSGALLYTIKSPAEGNTFGSQLRMRNGKLLVGKNTDVRNVYYYNLSALPSTSIITTATVTITNSVTTFFGLPLSLSEDGAHAIVGEYYNTSGNVYIYRNINTWSSGTTTSKTAAASTIINNPNLWGGTNLDDFGKSLDLRAWGSSSYLGVLAWAEQHALINGVTSWGTVYVYDVTNNLSGSSTAATLVYTVENSLDRTTSWSRQTPRFPEFNSFVLVPNDSPPSVYIGNRYYHPDADQVGNSRNDGAVLKFDHSTTTSATSIAQVIQCPEPETRLVDQSWGRSLNSYGDLVAVANPWSWLDEATDWYGLVDVFRISGSSTSALYTITFADYPTLALDTSFAAYGGICDEAAPAINEKYLAIPCPYDNRVMVHDVTSGTLLYELANPVNPIHSDNWNLTSGFGMTAFFDNSDADVLFVGAGNTNTTGWIVSFDLTTGNWINTVSGTAAVAALGAQHKTAVANGQILGYNADFGQVDQFSYEHIPIIYTGRWGSDSEEALYYWMNKSLADATIMIDNMSLSDGIEFLYDFVLDPDSILIGSGLEGVDRYSNDPLENISYLLKLTATVDQSYEISGIKSAGTLSAQVTSITVTQGTTSDRVMIFDSYESKAISGGFQRYSNYTVGVPPTADSWYPDTILLLRATDSYQYLIDSSFYENKVIQNQGVVWSTDNPYSDITLDADQLAEVFYNYEERYYGTNWYSLTPPTAGSLEFSAGDYLSIPYTPEIEFSNRFTMETWVKFTDTSAGRTLMAGYSAAADADYNWKISFSTASTLTYSLSTNGTDWDLADAEYWGTVDLDTWYHVALVRYETSITAYLQGSSVGTINTTSSLYVNSSTSGIWIGGDTTSTGLLGRITSLRLTQSTAQYLTDFEIPKYPLKNTYDSRYYNRRTSNNYYENFSYLQLKTAQAGLAYSVSGVTVTAQDTDRLFVGQRLPDATGGYNRFSGDTLENISFTNLLTARRAGYSADARYSNYRTNYVPYSEDFADNNWNKTNVLITQDPVLFSRFLPYRNTAQDSNQLNEFFIIPDYNNYYAAKWYTPVPLTNRQNFTSNVLCLLSETTAVGQHVMTAPIFVDSNTFNYFAYSLYVQNKNNVEKIRLGLEESWCDFDISSGTVITSTNVIYSNITLIDSAQGTYLCQFIGPVLRTFVSSGNTESTTSDSITAAESTLLTTGLNLNLAQGEENLALATGTEQLSLP